MPIKAAGFDCLQRLIISLRMDSSSGKRLKGSTKPITDQSIHLMMGDKALGNHLWTANPLEASIGKRRFSARIKSAPKVSPEASPATMAKSG